MPSVRLLVCLTALGFTLALGYRYSGLTPQQLWPFTPTVVAAQPAATIESELARTLRELDTLKKSVGKLTTANQQLGAAVTALEAGQQAIQQRVASAQFQGWHSIPPTMKFRMIAIQPKDSTGSIASHPTAVKAVAARPPKPKRNAPLPLTPPQP
jgi:hypothetical protein